MVSASSDNNRRRSIRIGKYEVLKHIATGGMGAVYRAVDTECNREVALKVLSPELALKPEILKRFQREARSAARLSHDNIVTVYEFGEFNGTYYMALEYVDGPDLHQYVGTRGKLEPEEARQIMLQAARALAEFHKEGIVHRDVKPSNFLIGTKEGRTVVKLTDLGLARGLKDDEDSRLTRDGTTVGTVDYLSPEQARDSRASDIRSDIYSLGCTFYHLLTGQPPFPDGGIAERICKHMDAEPPDVRGLNPAVSAGLAAVLRRMLAKKPGDRFQTPDELLQALEKPDWVDPPLAPMPQEDLVVAELAAAPPAPAAAPRPRSRPTLPASAAAAAETPPSPPPAAAPRPRKRRPREEDEPAKPAARKKAARQDLPISEMLWVGAAAGVLAVGVSVGLLFFGPRGKSAAERPMPHPTVSEKPKPPAPDNH